MKRKLALWALVAAMSAPLCAQTKYFPDGVFGSEGKVSDSHADWYTKQLRSMAEPPLWNLSKDPQVRVYRFTWIRSFDPAIVVRLTVQKDGTGILVTKITRKPGYARGSLASSRARHVSKDIVAGFENHVQQLGFWEMPTYLENPDFIGVDGAQWLMEGVRDGRYHVVDRWSPESSKERAFGIAMMIGLAKLKLLYQEVY